MIWRICSRQRREGILSIIDEFLYAEELEIDDDDTVFISNEIQKQIIIENFTTFADIAANAEDIKKLQDITVIAVNNVTKEEREISIIVEGGVWFENEFEVKAGKRKLIRPAVSRKAENQPDKLLCYWKWEQKS